MMVPEPPVPVRMRWSVERGDFHASKLPSTRASVLRAHSAVSSYPPRKRLGFVFGLRSCLLSLLRALQWKTDNADDDVPCCYDLFRLFSGEWRRAGRLGIAIRARDEGLLPKGRWSRHDPAWGWAGEFWKAVPAQGAGERSARCAENTAAAGAAGIIAPELQLAELVALLLAARAPPLSPQRVPEVGRQEQIHDADADGQQP